MQSFDGLFVVSLNKVLVESSMKWGDVQVDGLVQECSNSNALAMELLQFCTNQSMWRHHSRIANVYKTGIYMCVWR